MKRISTEIDAISLVVGEEKAVELVAKAGFDAWDFSMFGMGRPDWDAGKITTDDHPLKGADYLKFAKNLRKIGEDCGIVCNQAHAPFPSSWKDIRCNLPRAIECAAVAGAEVIVLHPIEFGSPEENAEFFSELLPFAKEYGVKIATENMWNWDREKDQACPCACTTAENFVAHLDAVKDPYFVACVDIGHAEMRGCQVSAVELIRALGHDRLKALHICDNDKWRDRHKLPFTMDIDFPPILRALKEIDYTGDFTLEAPYHLTGYTAENIFQGVCEMAESMKKLRAMYEEI